jgi:hypothetical protein
MVLEVLAQDNHKNTTTVKTSNTIRCGVFVIVLSQDFQHHSLWCFCDCPEPRLGVGNFGLGQSQKDHSEWCWKSWLRTITKTPQQMVLEVLAQDNVVVFL